MKSPSFFNLRGVLRFPFVMSSRHCLRHFKTYITTTRLLQFARLIDSVSHLPIGNICYAKGTFYKTKLFWLCLEIHFMYQWWNITIVADILYFKTTCGCVKLGYAKWFSAYDKISVMTLASSSWLLSLKCRTALAITNRLKNFLPTWT